MAQILLGCADADRVYMTWMAPFSTPAHRRPSQWGDDFYCSGSPGLRVNTYGLFFPQNYSLSTYGLSERQGRHHHCLFWRAMQSAISKRRSRATTWKPTWPRPSLLTHHTTPRLPHHPTIGCPLGCAFSSVGLYRDNSVYHPFDPLEAGCASTPLASRAVCSCAHACRSARAARAARMSSSPVPGNACTHQVQLLYRQPDCKHGRGPEDVARRHIGRVVPGAGFSKLCVLSGSRGAVVIGSPSSMSRVLACLSPLLCMYCCLPAVHHNLNGRFRACSSQTRRAHQRPSTPKS